MVDDTHLGADPALNPEAIAAATDGRGIRLARLEHRYPKLFTTIARYLVGTEPHMVRRLDVGPLVNDPETWEKPFRITEALRLRLAAHNPSATVLHVALPDIRGLVLGDRVGDVYSYGFLDDPRQICYLVVLPDGLDFHPPLTNDAALKATKELRRLQVAHAESIESELPVIDYLIAHLEEILPEVLNSDAQAHMRTLRYARWELDVRGYNPEGRAKVIGNMLLLLVAISKTTVFGIEDIMYGVRRKIAQQS